MLGTLVSTSQERPIPDKKSEIWRYVDLDAVLKSPLEDPVAPSLAVNPYVKNQLVFLNGKLQSTWSLDKGIEISDTFSGDFPKADSEQSWFKRLNQASSEKPVVIKISAQPTSPIDMICLDGHSGENATFVQSKIIVMVEKNIVISLYWTFQKEGASHLIHNGCISYFLGENAHVSVSGTTEGDHCSRFLASTLSLAANSTFKSVHFDKEGGLTHRDIDIWFKGEGASLSLFGLGLGRDHDQLFNRTVVHHEQRAGQSRQLFKTILTGSARAEYNGLVHVYPGAQKSDSGQLSRHMILSDNAKAYTRPQLKIFADDVKCAHGATVGQLEEDEVFYLMTRGLTKDQSKALLTYGFAEEILQEMEKSPLKAKAEKSLYQWVEAVTGNELKL